MNRHVWSFFMRLSMWMEGYSDCWEGLYQFPTFGASAFHICRSKTEQFPALHLYDFSPLALIRCDVQACLTPIIYRLVAISLQGRLVRWSRTPFFEPSSQWSNGFRLFSLLLLFCGHIMPTLWNFLFVSCPYNSVHTDFENSSLRVCV